MGSAFHQLCPRYSGTLTPMPLRLLGYGTPLPLPFTLKKSNILYFFTHQWLVTGNKQIMAKTYDLSEMRTRQKELDRQWQNNQPRNVMSIQSPWGRLTNHVRCVFQTNTCRRGRTLQLISQINQLENWQVPTAIVWSFTLVLSWKWS